MRSIFLYLALLVASSSNAADIYVEATTTIHIVGPIVQGDAEKFAALISKRHPALPAPVTLVEIASLGGDLNEAIRLASLIDGLKLRVVVKKGELCVSACFFLYLAGYQRTAWHVPADGKLPSADERKSSHIDQMFGYVGVHRPYFESAAESSSLSIVKQENLMTKVRAYLKNKGVHQSLVDEMMSHPSNDVYWLKEKDLEMIGSYSPGAEEILIRKCGYRRLSYVVDNNWSSARIEAMHQCIFETQDSEFSPVREKYVANLRSNWRPWTAR